MSHGRCVSLLLVAVLAGCGDNGVGRGDGGTVDVGTYDADVSGDAPDAWLDALVDAAPYCGDGHVDPDEECDEGIAGLSGDGCSSTCTTESITWTNLTPNPIPARWHHAMAYDSVRHRLVVFGGRTAWNAGPLNDTWEWDGSTWTQRVALVTPPARESHAMVFDSARQRVVMFGGDSGAGYLNDTWEWDGTTWTQRVPATSPPATALHYMAYDATRAVTVMCWDSTWEWDGTTWTQKTSSLPAALTYTDLVYAGSAGVMLLGESQNWLWNGTAWSSVSFTASVPWTSGPVFATYDELRDRVVAIAWHQSPADRMSVWEWTSGDWEVRAASVPGAPHLVLADVAYDPDNALLWLFGGVRPFNTETTAQLWDWNGTRWREHYDSVPSPRHLPLMTFDARRGRLVMFGGFDNGGVVLADTWEWDGTAWALRASSGPPPRGGHTITYDERRGKVVLFGGNDLDHQESATAPVPLSDLWEWDGSTWQQKSVTPSPLGTLSTAITYDRAHDYTLVFTNGQTWTWDGATWSQHQPAHPPPISNWTTTSMAYDARRGVAVLFGRYEDSSSVEHVEAWEWSGTDWIAKGSAPSGYLQFYDPVRARVILVEYGFPGSQQLAWAWDGAAWAQLTAVPGSGPQFVFDRANRGWITFGGRTGWDTWTATSGASAPREQCDGTDADGDGLARCGDPDCWWRCDPLCAPGDAACDPNRPRCGDALCSALESTALCPADCL